LPKGTNIRRHGVPSPSWKSPTDNAGITERGRVLWADQVHDLYAPALFHEVSHAIHYKATGTCPDDQLEDNLLALEYEVARRLRLNWSVWMEGYNGWDALGTINKSLIYAESRLWLQERHLFTADNKPTYRAGKR